MIKRKCQMLYVALLACCLLTPVQTWALGLGEIEVESALNERFEGNLALLDAQGFQSAEIVVSLASREDFDRIGVERFFYLTQLNFEVDLNASGGPQVVVSSRQPISEPYLNFIVEVLWPNGRLLKEFTVLLDPPTFSQAAAPQVSTPVQAAPAPRPQTQPTRPESQVTLRPTPAPAARPSTPRRPSTDGVYTTRDDTLWTIAARTLPSNEVSMNQQMLAIQRLNRNAFIRDNINLLKAGYELDLPTETEALSMTREEANYAVANQTNAWKTDTRVAAAPRVDPVGEAPADQLASQMDATGDDTASAATASDGQGQVRIVANTGELAAGTAGGSEQVNQLIEEKESLDRQVDELAYQLDREKEIATNQISVKERQLEVKDQEIAELQQQLKEVREQLAQAAQNQNQNQSAQPEAPQAWWQNPYLLMGVIGVLILALVVLMLALRRDRGAQDDYYEDDNEFAATEPQVDEEATLAAAELDARDEEETTQVEPTVGAVEDLDEKDEDDTEAYFDLDEEPQDGDDTVVDDQQGQTQTSDVIGEAEIYIAYGRYGQAANLLLGVLNEDPQRYDVRLKLLEVYVESNDDEQFEHHAQYILDNCSDEEVLLACRDLESQLSESRVVLDDADSDSTATGSGVDDAGADTNDNTLVGNDEGALSLDLDDADDFADLEQATGESADKSADNSDSAEEFELEFDLDSTEVEDNADDLTVAGDLDQTDLDKTLVNESLSGAGEENQAGGGDLGGDLGLDFDPETDVAEEVDAAQETAEDGFDLDELMGAEDAEENSADSAGAGADDQDGQDFDFDDEADGDVNATKLDLAEAYVDMGDADGARDILNEVVEEGSAEQQDKAREMLAKLD